MIPPDSKLRIAEIFASIQGEGIWVGIPSTFVRVSGCNLRCIWCDTPYASWHPEGPVLSIEEILGQVAAFALDHVVITGGEPMLFDATEDLARACHEQGRTITIETAGTVFRRIACDLMSISPKLANSTPDDENWRERHETTRLDRTPIQQLIDNYPYQLKFVVNPEEGDDISEIEELLSHLSGVEPSRVLLMAEGTDSETLYRRARMLVEPCLRRNWRLTPRLHVDLFGNTKGT